MRTSRGQDDAWDERDAFVRELHAALSHLHDANRLRTSPLAGLFGVADRFDAAAALRTILRDAIDSLKPPDDDPTQARAWRIYDSLFCCYVQQLSQRVVSDQLGISTRQLRREQRLALEALADTLWEQHALAQRGLPPKVHRGTQAAAIPGLNEELAWLQQTAPEAPADVHEELRSALELLHPLCDERQVGVAVRTEDALPSVAAHAIAVRQALIDLLTAAIEVTPADAQAPVDLSVTSQQGEVMIELSVPGATAPLQSDAAEDATGLTMARRLAELCGGHLDVRRQGDRFGALLTLPAVGQVPVLVVDDNEDTLSLFQRYTANTRYRVLGLRDPEQAVTTAAELLPAVVLLDVMMPRVDGWKVLSMLRHDPATSEIPVVVCTILSQEALALSLGAAGYLRKPFTREAFLAVLDGQTGSVAPEPR